MNQTLLSWQWWLTLVVGGVVMVIPGTYTYRAFDHALGRYLASRQRIAQTRIATRDQQVRGMARYLELRKVWFAVAVASLSTGIILLAISLATFAVVSTLDTGRPATVWSVASAIIFAVLLLTGFFFVRFGAHIVTMVRDANALAESASAQQVPVEGTQNPEHPADG